MVKTATNFYKTYYKKSRKKPIFAIVAVLIVVLFCFVIVLSNLQKNEQKEISYYAVHCGAVSSAKAEERCDKVANLGGAGVIYNYLGKLYVIAGVYLTYDDAKSVQTNIKTTFEEAGVIKILAKVISKKLKNKIYDNIVCKNYFVGFENFINRLYNISVEYDKSFITINEVYKQVMTYKSQIKNIENSLANNDDICKIMYSSCIVCEEYIDSFFSSAFVSANTKKYIKKLLVLMTFEFVNMCNTL